MSPCRQARPHPGRADGCAAGGTPSVLRSIHHGPDPGSAVALGSAWALNRNDPRRRQLLSVAGGLFAVTWAATAAYFVPELLRLIRSGHQLGAEEVARRGRRWRNLNWARLAVLAGVSVLAAAAAERRPAPRIRRLLHH